MIFIESLTFDRYREKHLTDDEFKDLQILLLKQPEAGSVIKGTKGLRKIRWATGNKGKRGGARIIYYWNRNKEQVYLATIYVKSEIKDLTSNEKKLLTKMVEEWERG